MRLRRTALPLLLAGIAMFATATSALAHTTLKSSSPASGAALATPPQQVVLTFAEAVSVGPNPIQVTGPGGENWTVGTATVAGAVVTAPVQPVGPAGQYTISYKVFASDGDAVAGAVRFTLTAPATPPVPPTTTAPATTTSSPPTPAPAAQSGGSSGGGLPWWAWAIATAVLVVGATVLAIVRNRRTPPAAE